MTRTHSWRTQTALSSTTGPMYHFGRTTGSRGQKTPARIVLPDRVPLHSDNRHVIRLHPRLSNPAAGAAEWLHYISDGPDERVNGKCVCVHIFTTRVPSASAASRLQMFNSSARRQCKSGPHFHCLHRVNPLCCAV